MHPAEGGEQLGRDPSKIGSSKSLVLKSFSGEGTVWESSLPVSLTLWDTPALFTTPRPLPQRTTWLWAAVDGGVQDAGEPGICDSLMPLNSEPIFGKGMRRSTFQ